MALINDGQVLGTGSTDLILNTRGKIYVRVEDRFYELNFKGGGTGEGGGTTVVNNTTINPEQDLNPYVTKKYLKAALGEYVTKRNWEDLMQTKDALENAQLDGFTESITPITVNTMQMIVGTQNLQFDFINSLTDDTVAPPSLYINESGQLVCPKGIIKHYTLFGPESVKPDTRIEYYARWTIQGEDGSDYTLLNLDVEDKPYYVYLRVPTSNFSSYTDDFVAQHLAEDPKGGYNGEWFVSTESHAIDELEGYAYLLVALITGSNAGGRSIGYLNGFTEILPGQITAYIFKTADGNQYLDFMNKRFMIGNDATGYMKWDLNDGLQIKGKISVLPGGDIDNKFSNIADQFANIQAQIDDEVQCWFSTDSGNASAIPLPNHDDTSVNWPVIKNDWDPKDHVGDLYYVVEDDPESPVNEQGQAFRYIKDGNRYYWTRVIDNSVSLALYNAYLAQQAADNAHYILSEIANDKIITIQEHGQLQELLDTVIAQCEQTKASAEPYKTVKEVIDAISNLDNCQLILTTFINENVLAKTDSYEINNDYVEVWDNVFSALKELSQAIAVASSDKIAGAQGTADAAIEKFKTWASDSVISGPEIPEIRNEKEFITNDFSEISSIATRYEITTKDVYTNYKTAYDAYLKDLNTILDAWNAKKSDVTEVNVPTDMKKHIEDFYKNRTTLLQEFAAKNAEVIKAAQDTADSAIAKFGEWANDGVISPLEISGIETEYNFIQQDYLDQSNKAYKLDLDSSNEWLAYNRDYNAYKESLEAILDWWNSVKNTDKKTDTYTIPESFETSLNNYYNSRLDFIKRALDASLVTDIDYIKDAIKKGRTDINGGLIMTGLIELGYNENVINSSELSNDDYYNGFKVMSGINGISKKQNYSDIAAWFGGPMIDKELDTFENTLNFSNKVFQRNTNSNLSINLSKWSNNLNTLYKNSEGTVFSYTNNTLNKLNNFIQEYFLKIIGVHNAITNDIIHYKRAFDGDFENNGDTYYCWESDESLGYNIIYTKTNNIEETTAIYHFSKDDGSTIYHDTNLEIIQIGNSDIKYFKLDNEYYFKLNEADLLLTFNCWESKDLSDTIYFLEDPPTLTSDIYTANFDILTNSNITKFESGYANSVFRLNGSGYLSGGNISWDEYGNLTADKLLVNSGIIGGLNINGNSISNNKDGDEIISLTPDSVVLSNALINGSLSTKLSEDGSSNFISLNTKDDQNIVKINGSSLDETSTYTNMYLDHGSLIREGRVGQWFTKYTWNKDVDVLKSTKSINNGVLSIPSFKVRYWLLGYGSNSWGILHIYIKDDSNSIVWDKSFEKFYASGITSEFIVPNISINTIKGKSYRMVFHIEGEIHSGINSDCGYKITVDPTVMGTINYSDGSINPGVFIGANGLNMCMGQNSSFLYLTPKMIIKNGNIVSDKRNTGGMFRIMLPSGNNLSDKNQVVGIEIQGATNLDGSSVTPYIKLNLGNDWRTLSVSDSGLLYLKDD